MCYTHKICLEQMRIWLLLWLVLILAHTNTFSIGTALVSGQCLGDQKSLLLELKNSLNFSASLSTKLIEWNPSNDSWDGVTCEGGQVTGLDLSSESITGVLDDSSSLFRLNHLQRLNLAYNSFQSSEIPSGFGNLTDLVYLNLSNAGFVGQVPIGISRLTRLVTLDVSLLYFPGLTSLKLENPNLKMLVANLSELRELYLDGVNVSATGNELCNALSSSLPKLQVLSMVNCYLSGPIESCSSLMNLRSLSVIKLGNNNLSSTVPEFFSHFHNLTTLHLSSCGLQGEFPQKIFQVQTLRTLDLSVNKLLQGSLPGFPENGSLQRLVLSFTNISGRLPESIANLRSLSRIELVNCSFHGNIPSSFTNLSQLTYLDFSFNNFTGSIPSLSKSENLTRIDLSHNNLTGQIDSMQWEYLLSLLILDLRFNLLEGNIPSSLFTLPSIQKLLLSNNRFSGQVKGSFNATSHMLNTLDLSNNNIGGELPVFIWELRGLKYLSLSSSNFSGSFHINLVQQLRNLSYLDLSYNRFSINATNTASQASSFPDLATLKLSSCQLRTLPEFLAEQHRLVSLDLSDNQIQGELPKWIWELQNLLYLNLSSNLLDDIDTLSHNLTSTLSVLDLHKNRLRGQTLPLPPFATHMDFSSNNFTLVILPAIGTSLSVAIFFSLSNNNIQGFIPKSICEAEYLQVLDLSHNNLSGNIPDCLVMGPLKVLNLRNNALDGSIIPKSICKAEYLEVLDLSHNNLTGNIPDCLMMESLKVLNLRNNALDGSIINFPGTCGLKTLDLSGNRLQGKLPKSLANCTAMEVLDIGNNQIDDVFPCQLKSIASLQVLVLRSNKFHGGVGCPGTAGTWKMLQIVDISSNNFSGKVPAQCLASWEAMKANVNFNHIQYPFLRLTGLYYQDTVSVTIKGLQVELVKILTLFTSIDFSCNNLDGPIPETLGDLKALYVLNLSNNGFSGPIPPSLGNLQQLESLDLSRNDLSGTIPTQLSDLNFLSALNLSYNKLVGIIPAVKQFLTFSTSSFEGNSGLCGPQLGIKCSNTNSSEHGKNDSDGWGSINFQFILVGLGFGAGAAVVVAPLTFWKTGQEWYDDQVDKLLEVVLPKMGFTYTRHHDDNSEGDEAFETSSTAILCSYSDYEFDEEEENEEEESWGRYCVFCSKLDLSVKKVIHDPKCTCYDSPPMSSSSSYSSSSSA
ncbi:receptor-like protein 7 isoform X2 [Rhodamnia argentea]|uniref:Receptor-like protein 7 isoform X2 n=1 Tax=Rhodamnia argentea TaxID=178133 RepID=A0ABM3GTP9_9MYRT|nr:receptor-like protein 7 isoform X2 [Rhodamnia argentea]